MLKNAAKRPERRTLLTIVVVFAAILFLITGPLRRVIETASYPEAYKQEVVHWAAEYNVDASLVYAVMRTESGYNPRALSHMGAHGLMQMTDETLDWLQGKIAKEETLSTEDLFRPEIAVRFGVYFLSICLERYDGDVETALAAYHSGWGTVDGLLRTEGLTSDGVRLKEFPYRQMRNYVSKVMRSYKRYGQIYS